MSQRIAVGLLMQESNSFSPIATTVETFEHYYLRRGDEVLAPDFEQAHTEVHGFLSVLKEAGAVPLPLLAASAFAGGPLTRQAFDTLVGEMEDRLRAAMPVDGLLLALHGALMVGEESSSGDTEIIVRMRKILPPHVPIGITFDLHGHITREMLQPNCFHVGYKHYPHTDIFETGQRAARLMLDTLAGKRRPVMALAKCPMVVSAVCARTSDGALVPVVEAAREAEQGGRVLHASLFPVQPWIDVPDLGFAALVCADGDTAVAQQVATHLAHQAWIRRGEFDPDLVSLEDAIRIGLSSPGLTAVSDAGDAPSGGSAADSTAVLRSLLAAGAQEGKRLVYLSMCDPAAVQWLSRPASAPPSLCMSGTSIPERTALRYAFLRPCCRSQTASTRCAIRTCASAWEDRRSWRSARSESWSARCLRSSGTWPCISRKDWISPLPRWSS